MNEIKLQHELFGSLIVLVDNCDKYQKTSTTDSVVMNALIFKSSQIDAYLGSINEVQGEIRKVVPYMNYFPTNYYDTVEHDQEHVSNLQSNLYRLKSNLIEGLRQIARNIYQAFVKGNLDDMFLKFIYKALKALKTKDDTGMLETTIVEMHQLETQSYDACYCLQI